MSKHPKGAFVVKVRDNNIDQALRVLRKKVQQEGIFQHVRAKQAFQSKGEERREDKAKQKRRLRKALTKQWEHSGLETPEALKKAAKGQRPPKQRRLAR